MNAKEIRPANLRSLAQSVGGITRLAERLDKSQSQISHLIGVHPIKQIGDKIAATAEVAFDKPPGWLDHIQSLEGVESTLASLDIEGVLCCQVPLISWKDIPAYLTR